MAVLLADEDFDHKVLPELRRLGHDVVTCQQAGLAGRGADDTEVLTHAASLGRAVLTFNRRHFIRLHSLTSHAGIIVCTRDDDVVALAQRIHDAITPIGNLAKQLVRIIRP